MDDKKMTLNADKATATVTNATLADAVTTVFDSNVGLTGAVGFAQKAALFVAGMAAQNQRLGLGLNPFKST